MDSTHAYAGGCTIHHLRSELFCLVFALLNYGGRVKVTHVSWRWRSAALAAHALLWSKIYIVRARRGDFEQSLARTGDSTSLDFTCTVRNEVAPETRAISGECGIYHSPYPRNSAALSQPISRGAYAKPRHHGCRASVWWILTKQQRFHRPRRRSVSWSILKPSHTWSHGRHSELVR